MYDVILSFITAFLLTFVAIPSIIHVSKAKSLMDEPGERHSHTQKTPNLGGIGIFAGMIFSIIMWTPFKYFGDLQYILCSFIILFLIGAKDDILPMSPGRKMLGQLFAAGILVLKANVIITSFYGIFGINELPYFLSVGISIFTIIVVINAFNLIDGINGLSSGLGILIALVLGSWFFLVDRIELTIVAYALAGACIGFLKYNVTPAKIFMGDTGSLLLGMVCSVLTIEFIEYHKEISTNPYAFQSAPAVAVGILMLPLFDTLRVFIIRMIRGKSPFYPDRTHIHHLMIDTGLSHMQATVILIVVNIFFIMFVVRFQTVGNLFLLVLLIGIAMLLTTILTVIANRIKAQKRTEHG